MRFRKKPIIIDAVQYLGNPVLDDPKFSSAIHLIAGENMAYVVTIHGQRVYLETGDWIIPEPDGVHFYPVKPDIFAATYEAVDVDDPPKGALDI